jgi:hypothetical protein
MMRRGFLAAVLAALVLALVNALFELAGDGLVFAMATVGTTPSVAGNVNEAMKVIFEEPLTNSIVSDSELLDLFEQDMNVAVSTTTGGRYIELAHYFQLPAGVGARTLEGDYIPVPFGPVIQNSQIYLKKIEGTVEMTGDVMRRVREGEGAFTNWARRALPDLKERVDHEMDRMLLGYGSGVRARVNDADPDDGDKTITIDANMGVAGLEDEWLSFMEGESIVFAADAAAATLRDSGAAYRIVDVNPGAAGASTLELATEPTANVLDSDFIIGGDAASHSGQSSGVDKEIMGLLGMVDDGTLLASFQGLTRATYRPWRSQIFDGSAAPWSGNITEDLLTKADDDTFVKAKGETTHIVMSRSGARNFWSNLKDDKRLMDPRGFTGGKASLNMIFGTERSVELRTVRKMPYSLVYGLQRDTFKHWRNTGWEWDDLTGSIWNRVTDATGRKDSFYAVGHIVLQTGNIAPHKSWKITGVSQIN